MDETSRDRLKWLIEFARMPSAKEWKEWEWIKVRDEIVDFAVGGDGGVFRFVVDTSIADVIANLDRKFAETLRLVVNDVLQAFVFGNEGSGVFINTEFGITANVVVFQSSIRNMFFVRLGFVINDEGISQIKKCPECGRLFYKTRKQKYCSKTCINRVSRR